jgi:type I restriction enzyme S subunit
MNETLEAMARAIFRDWFVDFGPTRAKMEGRAPYLAPEIWSLFPDRLDADGKPEGWEVGTLEALAHLNPESWSAKSAPSIIYYVDLANAKWGNIDVVERYRWDAAPSRARRVLRIGDTIVGTVRPGNGSYALISDDGLTGSTRFAVLRPKSLTDRALVWCAATSPENIERLAHLADGGAYPAVRPDVVLATTLCIPDDCIRSAFAEVVTPLLGHVENNTSENRTLAQIRDLLLPKLMSGEIRVRDAEQILEDV